MTSNATFSLGFNFDDALIAAVVRANVAATVGTIQEVFGALPDAPIPSARPHNRLPCVSPQDFARQVRELAENGIAFNYLMNVATSIADPAPVLRYVERLLSAGVRHLTVATPELCLLLRSEFGRHLHLTISITYGVRTESALRRCAESDADAVYLDAVYVNRNFELLRRLVRASALSCRLYANVSCISQCPVVKQHYATFSDPSVHSAKLNDEYFRGCTAVKLANPVEWIQMPWIRPEDTRAYVSEGISHFKLADRLAPTFILTLIANSYVTGVSHPDLFTLIERDGAKYGAFGPTLGGDSSRVISDAIGSDFIAHFRSLQCTSSDRSCEICRRTASSAVRLKAPADVELTTTSTPRALRKRLERAPPVR